MAKSKLPRIDFDWTPKLAYIIGLLTTDGSLSKDGRHITMLSSDLQLLQTFCSCFNLPKQQIKKRLPSSFAQQYTCKQSYRIQFGNVQFHYWLIKIGLHPNKTHTLKEIKIPDQYFKDFLRGWFDGDGTIYTYTDYYHTNKNPKYIYQRLYVKLCGVSIYHLKWLFKTIRRLTILKGAFQIQKSKNDRKDRVPYGEIKFSKKESIELLNWLYYKPNLPCLKRKYQIAKPYLKK